MMHYSTNPCPHCGKSRNWSAASFPNNTSATGTTVSAMGWNAIEPFLPPTIGFTPQPPSMQITFSTSEMCACTVDLLDEKLKRVTAERDALLDTQRQNDYEGDQYRLMPAVPLVSDVDKRWEEMRAYLAHRITEVFAITLQDLGITTDRKE